MKYKAFIWFAIAVCCIAFAICAIIGVANYWDTLSIFLLAGAVEFVLIWIFVLIGKDYCPSCGEYGRMCVIDQAFQGMKTIERNVPVSDCRVYRIDGKTHTVREMRNEKRYEDVEVWKFRERCTKCGYERIVEKAVE